MAATKRIYVTHRQETVLRRIIDIAVSPWTSLTLTDDEINSLVAILSKLDVAKEHT